MINAKSILLKVILSLHGEGSNIDVEQAYCLANNIYHEARSESLSGQVQVAHTTVSRVKDKRYPDTICGVVHSAKKDNNGNVKLNKCAFSWYCDEISDEVVLYDNNGTFRHIESKNYHIASMISIRVMEGHESYNDLCDSSNFYYNPKLASPVWAKIYTRKCEIGGHVFLKRDKGSLL